MKSMVLKVVLTGLVLGAASTNACPNFAGNWSCKNDDGSIFMESITQQDIPNGILLSLTSGGQIDQLYIDGKSHPTSMYGMTGTMTGTCIDDKTINYSEDLSSSDGSMTEKFVGTVVLQDADTQVDSAQITTVQNGTSSTTTPSGSCTRQ